MRKFDRSLFYIFLFLLALVSCTPRNADTVKKIPSAYVKEMVQSTWDSPGWDDPGTVKFGGEKAGSENQLSVFSRWNEDTLFFCFKVTDSDLRAYQTEKDHPKLYLDDMVEVLMDTRNDKDSCWNSDDIVYHVNLIGEKKDDRGSATCITDPLWDGEARITVQLFGTLNDTTDLDKGYLMTLSFPWKELEQKPQKDLKLGINFANGDNDGKGRQLFDWTGAWPMRSPYAYGNLILEKVFK